MSDLDLSLMVAMTRNRVIGLNNTLPWTIPSDLRRFSEITKEIGTVIVGNSTFKSIIERNKKPLPKREHIVLSRQPHGSDGPVHSVTTVESALDVVRRGGGRACVIGGTQIYELFLPYVNRMLITTIDTEIEGDAYFPKIDLTKWRQIGAYDSKKRGETDQYPTSYSTYERITWNVPSLK